MKIEKKEKLIKFTREEKNKLKILIPCIVIGLIVFLVFENETNWGKKEPGVGISILFELVSLSAIYIWVISKYLFETKEEILRKNKISLIIFSDDRLWELILLCIMAPIVFIIIFETSEIIIITIIIIAIIFISVIPNIISNYFKRKLK